MAIPQPRDLTSAGESAGSSPLSHVGMIGQILRKMMQDGADWIPVEGYEGLYLPTAATMPQHTWAGIVELCFDSGFRSCGQFYPEDQTLIEAEYRHWFTATEGQVQR